MLYTLYCQDKPDSREIRLANRPAHVAYLESHEAQLRFAGPLLSDDGQAMLGSLIVIDVPDRAAAEAFAAGDPYAKAGLFAVVRIAAVRQVFPKG